MCILAMSVTLTQSCPKCKIVGGLQFIRRTSCHLLYVVVIAAAGLKVILQSMESLAFYFLHGLVHRLE